MIKYMIFLLSLFLVLSNNLIYSQNDFRGIFSNYQQYLSFYDIDHQDVKAHYFYHEYTASHEKHRLFVQKFSPLTVKGRVIYAHGYTTHSGRQKMVLDYFLDRGYEVWLFDLPGHGFSSGVRHGITSFKDYGDALYQISTLIPEDDLPLEGVGHSTGASAYLLYLQYYPDRFDKIILVAPLILNRSPVLSYIFLNLFKGDKNELIIPARPGSQKDADTGLVNYKDPLESHVMNVSYLNSLFQWNKIVSDYPVLNRPIYVIQGTKDKVLDWKDNISFLKYHFTNLKVSYVQGGEHSLLKETSSYKQTMMVRMDKIFHSNGMLSSTF